MAQNSYGADDTVGSESADTRTARQRTAERVKAAGAAARESIREHAESVGETLKSRSGEAREWARTQVGGIQEQVESNPQRATLIALGLGVVVGALITTLMRGNR